MTALRVLERYAGNARRAHQGTRCELCAGAIGERHRHVVDIDDRKLLCACIACSLLFPDGPAGRYRAVPTRARTESSFTMTEEDLTRLGVPVGLVFFFRASRTGRCTAVFPSPAGSTEAEVDGIAWSAFADKSPLVASLADDVEALLVHRRRNGRTTCFVAPIDACYELTALLKRLWQGIDGGDAARDAVDGFLSRLESEGSGS